MWEFEIDPGAIADLHVHTSFSADGKVNVREIFRGLKGSGLKTLAITDHHSVKAPDENMDLAERYGIKLLPGVEISTANFSGCHILGLGMDKTHVIKDYYNATGEQVRKNFIELINTLEVDHGIHLDCKFIQDILDLPTISRKVVMKEIKHACTAARKPDLYWDIVNGNEIKYVNSPKPNVKDAVDLIKSAGGVPCLAHPWVLRDRETEERLKKDDFEYIINDFKDMGLCGLECSAKTEAGVDYFSDMAENFGLLRVGGSDFHGVDFRGKVQKKLGTVVLNKTDLERLDAAIDAMHGAPKLPCQPSVDKA